MALGKSIKMYLTIFIATTCIYMVLYQYHISRQPLPSPEILKNKEILGTVSSETEKQSGNNIMTSRAGDLMRRYNLFLWSPMSMLSTLQQPQQKQKQKQQQSQQNDDIREIHGEEILFYELSNTSQQQPQQPEKPKSFLKLSSSSSSSSLLRSPSPSPSALTSSPSSSSSSSPSSPSSSSSSTSTSLSLVSIVTQSKGFKHLNRKTSGSSNNSSSSKIYTPHSTHHDIHSHRSGQQYSTIQRRHHHGDHNNNIENDGTLPLGNASNNATTSMATITTAITTGTTTSTSTTTKTTTTLKETSTKSQKLSENSSISTNSSSYIHPNEKFSTIKTITTTTTMISNADATTNKSNIKLKFKQKFLAESSPPPLYIITPTYRRPEQLAELTRLGYTLKHVINLLWLVIEDANRTSPLVTQTLNRIGVPYEYLVAPMPEEYKKTKKAKPRGVSNRNRGLQWLRKNATEGVFYFADDDNTYDIAIFEQMRYTQKVSMWPVGLVTKFGVSSPIIRNGKIDGFYDGWIGGRKYAVDMAGFAVSVKFLHDRPAAKMPFKPGYEEDGFLKSLAPLNNSEIELLASECTEILTWHTQTKKNPPAERLNTTKYGNTNLVNIDKLLVRP